MADTLNEGDTIVDGDGNRQMVSGGKLIAVPKKTAVPDDISTVVQPLPSNGPFTGTVPVKEGNENPSTLADFGKALPGAIEKGAVAAVTSIPSAVDLLAQSAGKLEEKFPQAHSGLGKATDAIHNKVGQLSYEGLQGDIEPYLPDFMGYEPKTTGGKIASSAVEFLPSAFLGGEGGIGSKLLRAGSAGVGSEAAGELTEGTPAEPYARIGGGMLGATVPGMARRVVTPNPADPERLAQAALLRSKGVDVSAGQATGSPGLQSWEGAQAQQWGAPQVYKNPDVQQRQVTGAILGDMGVNGDRADRPVIQQGRTNLSNDVNGLMARHPLTLDTDALQAIHDAHQNYHGTVRPSQIDPAVDNALNDIANRTNMFRSPMTGQQYQSTRASLMAEAQNADPDTAKALRTMAGALDENMDRKVAGTPDEGAWRNFRQQWGASDAIKSASELSGPDAANGMVSPAAVYQYIHDKDNPVAHTSRAAQAVAQPLPQKDLKTPGFLGDIIGGLLGGARGYMNDGMREGAEEGTYGHLMGPGIAKALTQNPATAAATFSRPGQAYLENQLWQPNAGLSLGVNPAIKMLTAAPGMNEAISSEINHPFEAIPKKSQEEKDKVKQTRN